jgi:hypothetical protein
MLESIPANEEAQSSPAGGDLLPFFRSHAQAKLAAFPEAGSTKPKPCLMIHLRRLLPEVSPPLFRKLFETKRRESGGTMGHLEGC